MYLATPAGDGSVDHSNLPATHGPVTFVSSELGVLPCHILRYPYKKPIRALRSSDVTM